MPPVPKDPSTRARRNKTSTNAILRPVANPKIPALPKGRHWNSETRAWWKDVWSSPMAPEYDDSDFHAIQRLAMLVDVYYSASIEGDVSVMLKLAAEIRMQEQRFGLTPIDRRRLQWTIDQGEAAEEKTAKRRAAKRAAAGPKAVPDDPRSMLA